MIGGIIGDLAASTYLRDSKIFYKQLFDDKATLSEYGLSVIAVASFLKDSCEGTGENLRERTIELLSDSDYSFAKRSKSTEVLANTLSMLNAPESQGLLLVRLATNALISDDPEKTATECFLGDYPEKEQRYSRLFINKIITFLHSGSTKDKIYEKLGEIFKDIRHNWEWKERDTSLCILMRAWDCFYKSFDFGSAIHNAVRYPNSNIRLLATLTGLIAEAMYGSRSYFVKKKFKPEFDEVFLSLPADIEKKYETKLQFAKRQLRWNNVFWPKNDSRTNVEWHVFHTVKSRYDNLIVSKEIRRRILRSFEPGWESRFSFYLDNGWIYICRSFFILGRFKLIPYGDGYKICHTQQSDKAFDFDEAFQCAYDIVERQWASLGQLHFKYLRNYWYSIETENCPEKYIGTIKEKFWHGEKMFYETQMDNLGNWIDEGKKALQTLNNPRVTEFAKNLGQERFGVAYYINTLFAKWSPMEILDWIFEY